MMRNIIFVLIVFFASCGLAFSEAPKSASSSQPQQMQDFNLAGYGAQGQKTWEVDGAQMDMVDNEIKITDIKAHLYGDKENMVLTADKGNFDKEKGVVHLTDHVKAVTESGAELNTESLDWAQKQQLITTDDKVNIQKDSMTTEATGIEAQPSLKTAKFGKDVTVTLDDKKKTKDTSAQESPFGKGKIVITCDGPMELNYEKQYAIFEKNVRVDSEDKQNTMLADKMTLTFSPTTKQIDKMDAQGNVKITRGENISYSEGAIFTAADKRVVLTGRPKLVIYTEGGLNVSP